MPIKEIMKRTLKNGIWLMYEMLSSSLILNMGSTRFLRGLSPTTAEFSSNFYIGTCFLNADGNIKIVSHVRIFKTKMRTQASNKARV